MIADERFTGLPKQFWANVRLISEKGGYTVRGKGRVKVPTIVEVTQILEALGLRHDHVSGTDGTPTDMGQMLLTYFDLRAQRLQDEAEPNLMDAKRARKAFMDLKRKLRPKCPLPMNKQRGKKRKPAYLTGMVNMLVEANCEGVGCDYDPRGLTTITADGIPVRTLARRVDGAFPSTTNPIAVWEIKEYYHTTTFGSRVADGVYETLLDGVELEELRLSERISVKHYLIIDAHYTWWECGRSYLCRIFDMLHMGYVDEVLVGCEVIERLPELVREWVRMASEVN